MTETQTSAPAPAPKSAPPRRFGFRERLNAAPPSWAIEDRQPPTDSDAPLSPPRTGDGPEGAVPFGYARTIALAYDQRTAKRIAFALEIAEKLQTNVLEEIAAAPETCDVPTREDLVDEIASTLATAALCRPSAATARTAGHLARAFESAVESRLETFRARLQSLSERG